MPNTNELNRKPDAEFGNTTHDSVNTGGVSSNLNDGPYQVPVDGLVVPVAPNLGVGDAIDPADTPTPVQDAIDKVDLAGGGEVILPRQTVTEESPNLHLKGNTLRGVSRGNQSEISFTTTGSATAHGVEVTSDSGAIYNVFLNGPGLATNSGDGINISGVARSFNMDWVNIQNFGGSGIKCTSTAFEMSWGRVGVNFTGETPVSLTGLGPANFWALAKLNIEDERNIAHFKQKQGQMHIATANLGGNVGGGGSAPALKLNGGRTIIDQINYEPIEPSYQYAIADVRTSSGSQVGNIWAHTGTVDNVYITTSNAGNAVLGPVNVSQTTINNKRYKNVGDTGGPIYFYGKSTELNEASGVTLAEPIICFGDLVTVS